MKLYYCLGEWQLPGQQDKAAERVEIPTDTNGLCAWLNHRRVPIAMPLAPAPQAAPSEAIHQPEPPPRPMAGKTAFTVTEIESFILDHASVAQVERIFAALGARFAEARA